MIRGLIAILMGLGVVLLTVAAIPGLLIGMLAGLLTWSYKNGVELFNRICLSLMY